jgi:hypothetical protein
MVTLLLITVLLIKLGLYIFFCVIIKAFLCIISTMGKLGPHLVYKTMLSHKTIAKINLGAAVKL